MECEQDSPDKCHQVRVQFSNELKKEEDGSIIQVRVMNQFLVNVHLGFLQYRHKYEINFKFECCDCLENALDLDSAITPHSKIVNLKLVKTIKGSKSKPCAYIHSVTAHLFAHQEKLLKEKLFITSNNVSSHSITFIFYARVLGNGIGTPILKDGIKCIGFEDVDDDNDDNNS